MQLISHFKYTGYEEYIQLNSLVLVGFQLTFGIHHDSQLNAFNLADDLIEPYRAIVDLVAHKNIGSNVKLNKTKRRELAHVLHNVCMVEGVKVNVFTAIYMMCELYPRHICELFRIESLQNTIIEEETSSHPRRELLDC